MINFLIVTHGDFGAYLIEAAENIVGPQPEGVLFVPLSNRLSLEEARARISTAIARLESPDGLILLIDMLGGTPGNIILPLVRNKPRVAVLGGCNLYMLISGFAQRRNLPFEQLSEKMLRDGIKSISDVKQLFMAKLRPITSF
ncbi:MAG: hypothetical protein HY402_02545 [Elusimicrobia bacterium]|nr:hypothetical protein [Elusimicrobiota bacterium]